MKNKFFYNKFLPVLSVFLIVLFTFVTSSYCANSLNDEFYYPDEITTYFNVTTDNSGTLVSQTLYYKNNTYYLLVWYVIGKTPDNTNLYLKSGVPYPTSIGSPNDHCCIYTYNNSSATWSNTCWWYYSNHNFPSGNSSGNPYNYINGAELISTSKDIYTDSSLSEIFFYKVPPVEIPEITATLVEETEKVQIAEQLKIMIVGFLKYLIVLVISLIAFWKGWQFLSTQLRKA